MAFDTFTYVPSWGAKVKRKAKRAHAEFMDGYEQIAGIGLNHNPQAWDLRWDVEEAVADAIEAWFEAHDLVPFKWTNPRGQLLVWTIQEGEWDRDYPNPGQHIVTARFKQNFTPE